MLQARALVCACSLGLSSLLGAWSVGGCSDTSARLQARAQSAGREARAQPTRADCSACHERDYERAPKHVDVKPTRCATCHSENGWHATQLNHTWALTGAHAKTNCSDCHKGSAPDYELTHNECVDCHRRDLEQVKAPRHDLAATSCADCHTSVAWQPATQPLRTEPAVSISEPALRTEPPQPIAASPEPERAIFAPIPAPGATPESRAIAKQETAKRSRRTAAATKRRALRGQPKRSGQAAARSERQPGRGASPSKTQASAPPADAPPTAKPLTPRADSKAKPAASKPER